MTFGCGDDECSKCYPPKSEDEARGEPYDNGGIVPPGPTWVYNDSGKDVTVRKPPPHRPDMTQYGRGW